MKLAAAAVFLFLFQASPVTPPQLETPKGVLEGIVLRADTGEPVAGAEVSWRSSLDPLNMFNGPNPNAPVSSDRDGKFTFKDLKPATYWIYVTANGYVRQEYGQRVLNSTGRPVYLLAGQTVKDLVISLTGAATVTGRILNDMGQPASDILVQLVRASYSLQGRTFSGVAMSNADDRGEFRIFGVAPGRYYLVAGNVFVLPVIAPGAGDVSSLGRMSRTNYVATYFPGVPDLDGATLLELKPGAELRANLTVSLQQGYRVSGRVVNDKGQVAAPGIIALSSQSNPQSMLQPILTAMRNSSLEAGTFEFLNVPPGAWTVFADIPVQAPAIRGPVDAATSAARNSAEAIRPYGQTPFTVTNANIEGLVVTLRDGATVSARVILEGNVGNEPPSILPNLDRISMDLQAQVFGATSRVASRPAPDGTLQIAGIRDGEYALRVRGIPPGFYVQSARYSGQDVLNKALRFSGSSSGVLEVTFRPGAAQISGTVTELNSLAVSGIQAVLIPEPPLRNRTDLYKTAITDRNGRFTMNNLTPGNYKLFSWEGLDQNGYYNPDRMKQFEAQGIVVHVEEFSNAAIDVKMIPVSD